MGRGVMAVVAVMAVMAVMEGDIIERGMGMGEEGKD
jgi:hypothetical protein